MSEMASRRLFGVELALASPAIAWFIFLDLLSGGTMLWFAAPALADSVAAGFRQTDGGLIVFLTITVVSVCFASLVGFIIFARLSWRFWKDGRRGLRPDGRLFELGLLCGAPPLMLVLVAASSTMLQRGFELWAFATCLAVFLVLLPIVHLWIELGPSREPGLSSRV